MFSTNSLLVASEGAVEEPLAQGSRFGTILAM